MKNKPTALFVACAFALGMSGCFSTETGNPSFDPERVEVVEADQQMLRVVGSPGAVTGLVELRAANLDRSEPRTSSEIAGDGSFEIVVLGMAGDVVRLDLPFTDGRIVEDFSTAGIETLDAFSCVTLVHAGVELDLLLELGGVSTSGESQVISVVNDCTEPVVANLSMRRLESTFGLFDSTLTIPAGEFRPLTLSGAPLEGEEIEDELLIAMTRGVLERRRALSLRGFGETGPASCSSITVESECETRPGCAWDRGGGGLPGPLTLRCVSR